MKSQMVATYNYYQITENFKQKKEGFQIFVFLRFTGWLTILYYASQIWEKCEMKSNLHEPSSPLLSTDDENLYYINRCESFLPSLVNALWITLWVRFEWLWSQEDLHKRVVRWDDTSTLKGMINLLFYMKLRSIDGC